MSKLILNWELAASTFSFKYSSCRCTLSVVCVMSLQWKETHFQRDTATPFIFIFDFLRFLKSNDEQNLRATREAIESKVPYMRR